MLFYFNNGMKYSVMERHSFAGELSQAQKWQPWFFFVSRLEYPNLSNNGGIRHEKTTMGKERWRRSHESNVVPETHLETEAETKVDQIPEPQAGQGDTLSSSEDNGITDF